MFLSVTQIPYCQTQFFFSSPMHRLSGCKQLKKDNIDYGIFLVCTGFVFFTQFAQTKTSDLATTKLLVPNEEEKSMLCWDKNLVKLAQVCLLKLLNW
jgi:hypothetical protein